MQTNDVSVLHRHALIKRGIVQFRLGNYAAACEDLQAFSASECSHDSFVATLTQAISLYLLDNNSKAKRLYKEAMGHSRDLELDAHVQKALGKAWSKLNRIRLRKVFGKLRRGSSSTSMVVPTQMELDVLRE